MTNRMFFEQIVDGSAIVDGALAEAIVEHARKQIAVLDSRNASRKNSPSVLKKKAEKTELMKSIVALLTESDVIMSARQIAEALDEKGTDTTAAKVSAVVKDIEGIHSEPFKPEGQSNFVKGYSMTVTA